MFWGRKQSTPDHLLVLDIGTAYVKAAVFYVADNQAHLTARGLAKQPTGGMRGGMIVDLPSVADACQQAIDYALGESDIKLDSVILGVNGQLIEGVTTTVHYDRAHPDQPIEQAELKNIIYIQQRSSEKLRASLREKFLDDHPDIELIHAGVVDVQLDGYAVENPVGFQGKRLTLTIFNAYIPLVYASILQNLAKELGLTIASIAAQPYGLSKIFSTPNGAEEAKSGIFIDIGGGTTDVVIVKNGTVEGMQSFAFGGEAFTRAIKRRLGLTLDRAEKMKLQYAEGKLERAATKKVSDAIADDVRAWLLGVELALGEFHEMKLLPPRIYLTGGCAPLPDLKRALLTKGWTEKLPFAKKPFPLLVRSTDVLMVVNDSGDPITAQDIPPLALTKLTLDLTVPDDAVTNTLQSIVRSMKQ